ncbi:MULTISPECIES: aconitate hydratase AcnA [Roseomonadaceae]|uniref:aconitate hydratase AcnA n=1 Tax=Roseomonadaceae TaxID=3385906 RepID=UPI002E75D602|nr:aconitate hydratase AcnA [Roseomonas oleicola]
MTIAEAPLVRLSGAFTPCLRVDLPAAAGAVLPRLPWCHRVLLENQLRQPDPEVARAGRAAILAWPATGRSEAEIPFVPRRILMHDTTCGPALADIAAMRDALAEAGGDPSRLNPLCPVETSVDHSVAIDVSGVPDALARNMAREFERNGERYRFMKWAAGALRGFRVFPPGTGILHTINLERLATVVSVEDGIAIPDTLVGTDSHTPMVNGLGVLGWGVGGIEAEGVMFGVPLSLRLPDVFGVRLTGALPEGVLATDLALVVTERLRRAGVAGQFVEFLGPGIASLSAGERAVVANMAPEYGATTGCFPIDARTLAYLRDNGRDAAQCALIEAYARAQGLWYAPDATPRYTETIEIDLASLRPSLAGPRRPQDRLEAGAVATALAGLPAGDGSLPADAVALAAITSCTNTTDLGLLIAAGLLARKARTLGLKPAPWVKTSLAPGSPAAALRLRRAGLLEDLEALGFGIAAYGCTTCIGNAGPLLPVMAAAVEAGLRPIAVLSGNRNFPGRVHAQIEQALLASPPLVIAFALAGRTGIDVTRDALGTGPDGVPVHLAQLWPGQAEVQALLAIANDPGDAAVAHAEAEASGPWAALEAPEGARFPWDPASTYLRRPPFVDFGTEAEPEYLAHPLLVLGDDVTTDHISPAGAIPPRSDAAAWLLERGEDARDLNVYAARRGNWEVMLRGLFTNRTLVNHLAPGAPPGHTRFGEDTLPVWQAAARYAAAGDPVVVVAGERYGAGSSRDWAAKGLRLLGVRAVIAASFERIHRANLIGMGILPLRLPPGWDAVGLGLRPGDRIEVLADPARLAPRAAVTLRLHRANGATETGQAVALLETALDVALIRGGGIIPEILRRALLPISQDNNQRETKRC